MHLKICGLRESDNVEAVLNIQPDYTGFIFAPDSPRYFKQAKCEASIAEIKPPVKKVGVFVNESLHNILSLHNQHRFDYVQLHGNESEEECSSLKEQGLGVIKSFPINDNFDFSVLDKYAGFADLFLFDTAGKLPGGNGFSFNWQLLKKRRFKKPFLLSGGIGPSDLDKLKLFNHPDMAGIDVNSRFEISPGVKDIEALRVFKEKISQYKK